MRRAAVVAVVIAAGGIPARAAPWTVSAETGAEYDTNVQRVETGPNLDTPPVKAGVFRIGGKVATRAGLAGGTAGLGLGLLGRVVNGGEDVSPENVILLTADARWLHPIGDRPLAAGVAIVGADALPLTDAIGARTFANVGADALLALHDDDDRRFTLALGGRAFTYKPDRAFDWVGPVVNARLDLALWTSAARTRTLELGALAGFELRDYAGKAFADACPLDAMRSPACFAPTALARVDRYHRVGVELTWSGGVVASLGYQLVVIDSNSYGQSLVRHRAQASVTAALPWQLYGTVLAIAQLDTYLDGLVVDTDPNHQTFTSLDDENRSSLQLRLGRPLTKAWAIEGRVAVWRNLGASDNAFARELAYVGAIFTR